MRRHTLLTAVASSRDVAGVTQFYLLLRAAEHSDGHVNGASTGSRVPAPVVEYIAVSYVALAPVDEYMAPAPSRDAALALVVVCISPVLVGCAAPASVVENIAPAPRVSHVAPAPVGEYMAPAASIAASKDTYFFRASGLCGHELSLGVHREGAHWVFGRLVRLPHARRVALLGLASSTSSRRSWMRRRTSWRTSPTSREPP